MTWNINNGINALENPLDVGPIKYDDKNRPSFKVIGEKTTLYINPKSGNLTTSHRTSSKKSKKLKGENNED